MYEGDEGENTCMYEGDDENTCMYEGDEGENTCRDTLFCQSYNLMAFYSRSLTINYMFLFMHMTVPRSFLTFINVKSTLSLHFLHRTYYIPFLYLQFLTTC